MSLGKICVKLTWSLSIKKVIWKFFLQFNGFTIAKLSHVPQAKGKTKFWCKEQNREKLIDCKWNFALRKHCLIVSVGKCKLPAIWRVTLLLVNDMIISFNLLPYKWKTHCLYTVSSPLSYKLPLSNHVSILFTIQKHWLLTGDLIKLLWWPDK